jgi:hypothetical protein
MAKPSVVEEFSKRETNKREKLHGKCRWTLTFFEGLLVFTPQVSEQKDFPN